MDSDEQKVTTRRKGQAVETAALAYLEEKGLRYVCRNFRCRYGEIDLIMTQGNTLVFIEVRYRKQNSHGSAAESVISRKQQKLTITAQYYLQSYKSLPRCRFDVVAVSQSINNKALLHFDWIKNAFDLQC